VLALALAQIIASVLPDLLDWTWTIAERSARLQTPTVPISFAFSIWSLIFAGSLAFAIFGILQRNRDNGGHRNHCSVKHDKREQNQIRQSAC
jgi:TRAP-type C4-dicarboxylate transport system permease small subunit